MELDNYYEEIMSYDELLVTRSRNGRIDDEKRLRCGDKLRQWWKLAREIYSND